MKVQLVSYINGLSNKVRLNNTINIINKSTADLILFSGHTIGTANDIEKLKIKNKKVEAILELRDICSDMITNCLYHIKNGKLMNMYTNQLFTSSEDIKGNYQLADRLLNELETRRTFTVGKLNCLVIQCGENNILKNIQKENNRVEFRLNDNKQLSVRFDKIVKNTNIFLNPMHTPMGNQGKIEKRREFLSVNKKYYFSTSNTKDETSNLKTPSLQYAFNNGYRMRELDTEYNESYVVRTYSI